MKSVRVFSLLFSLVMAIILLEVAFPVTALSNASITVVSLADYTNDCGQSSFQPYHLFSNGSEAGVNITFVIDYTDLVSDPGYGGAAFDRYSVVLRDANGILLGFTQENYVPLPPSPFNPPYGGEIHVNENTDQTMGGIPTSRPWTFTVYDLQNNVQVFPPTPADRLAHYLAHAVVGTTTFDPAAYSPACAALPFIGDSLNSNGKLEAQIFNAEDDNGDPILHVYEINDAGDGEFSFAITQADLAPFIDNPPANNTEIKSSASGKVTLYVLDTGEFQINIGPDEEGNVYVTIFTGLPPTNIYSYTFNVYDIPEE
jgi:hypothetical protein